MDKTQIAYKIIVQKYQQYIEIYKFVNGGSTEGITTFDEFYWRFAYYERYADPTSVGVGNG